MSKFNIEDRKWLKEILTWLIAAQKDVTLNLVKEAAERFIGDEFLQFHDFVEVDCGTLLHLISTDSDMRIELVHETFRAFLTDSASCPYPIPTATAHDHILGICFDVLRATPDLPLLKTYAYEYWVQHVAKASQSSLELIDDFLQSDAYKLWLSERNQFSFSKRIAGHCSSGQLYTIISVYNAVEDLMAEKSPAVGNDVTRALDIKKFDMYTGRAWTELWAYHDSPLMPQMFMHVLRNYTSRCGQTMDDVKLKSIAANNFSVLLGDSPRFAVKNQNLGIACAVLQEWDKSIKYLTGLSSVEARQYLGLAYFQTREYKKAIEELTPVADSAVMACRYLGLVYWANGDIRGAIEALEAAWNLEKSEKTLVRLNCLYFSQESANEIETYKSGVDAFPDQWWAWQFLSAAYLVNGDFESYC